MHAISLNGTNLYRSLNPCYICFLMSFLIEFRQERDFSGGGSCSNDHAHIDRGKISVI